MKALLIVGMQVDLMPGGPAEVPGCQELTSVINDLEAKFDLVLAANFHMPANHLAFAGNHPWRHPGQVIQIEGSPALLRTIFCVPGTFGAEFIPGLNMQKIAFTALMGTGANTPPHSAFFDAEKRRATNLLAFLKEKKVAELYIAGMPLEVEVKNSALDGQAAGFSTFLVQDASRGRSQEAIEAALSEIKKAGVQVVFSHQI